MSVATLVPVASKDKETIACDRGMEAALALELVRQAKDAGVGLTGPGGLLKQFTKTV